MKKRVVDAAQWIVFMPLVFLLAILGPSAKDIDEARASEAWEPSKDATASINSEACVCGQAIACVVPGSETQLAKEYDSVESLLKIDAQSSSCGPCDLVLVRSSSRTVEELVAKLEASEAVFFAEPNYLEELRSEGDAENIAEQSMDDPEELAEQPKDDLGMLVASQDGPEGLQSKDAADPPTDASSDVARPDHTNRQYAFNTEFGIGVPGWNTYDSAGNPTPLVNTAGKVVAILDTGVDYNHEDLRNAMWSDGESYPALVALGGGRRNQCGHAPWRRNALRHARPNGRRGTRNTPRRHHCGRMERLWR
ncbi:MAG: hypothetical protein Q4A07_11695 [Coriobacteriales bacterium]|nr:hypothetical protein [Coriobacteriales bacterium]